jgi:mono/diheme cytochrome c family protein
MRTGTVLTLAVASALAVPAAAAAQTTAGEIEYQQACAACHGAAGQGDGPVADYMNVPVPDLTKIAERRNGASPYQELMQMIDGRNAERQPGPHGTSMPVWGDRFMLDSGSAYPVENEINTLGRISSLVDYLYSLQQ